MRPSEDRALESTTATRPQVTAIRAASPPTAVSRGRTVGPRPHELARSVSWIATSASQPKPVSRKTTQSTGLSRTLAEIVIASSNGSPPSAARRMPHTSRSTASRMPIPLTSSRKWNSEWSTETGDA